MNDVDLSDLPDFLAGEGTDISLVNPQIYLKVNNPVGNDRLDCRTGLTLSAIRNSQVSAISLPRPKSATVCVGMQGSLRRMPRLEGRPSPDNTPESSPNPTWLSSFTG